MVSRADSSKMPIDLSILLLAIVTGSTCLRGPCTFQGSSDRLNLFVRIGYVLAAWCLAYFQSFPRSDVAKHTHRQACISHQMTILGNRIDWNIRIGWFVGIRSYTPPK